MNFLLARVKNRSRSQTYRKILSEQAIYSLPDNLGDAITYSPKTLIDDGSWYKIENFSSTSFCIDLLKNQFVSVDYAMLENSEFELIDYLCSYQDDIYYFQNISKMHLKRKSLIHIGDACEYIEKGKILSINSRADAIYVKASDTLFFMSLSKITGIFKNIGELYREATDEETAAFLNSDFICLINNYSASSVKTANRKRIAMVLDSVSQYGSSEKKKVLKYIHKYCPNMNFTDNSFSIGSEEELKQLLWGLEQRYYTTLVGKENRVANSIITLPQNPS